MMLEITVVLRPSVMSLAPISGVISATMSSGPSRRSRNLMSGSRMLDEPSMRGVIGVQEDHEHPGAPLSGHLATLLDRVGLAAGFLRTGGSYLDVLERPRASEVLRPRGLLLPQRSDPRCSCHRRSRTCPRGRSSRRFGMSAGPVPAGRPPSARRGRQDRVETQVPRRQAGNRKSTPTGPGCRF